MWFSTKFLLKQGVTYVPWSYFIFTFFSPMPYDAMRDFLNFLKMLNIRRVAPMDIDSPLSSKKEWIIRSNCVKSVQIRRYFWSIFSSIRTRNNSVFEQFSCSVYYVQKRNFSLNIRTFLPDVRVHVFFNMTWCWWQNCHQYTSK